MKIHAEFLGGTPWSERRVRRASSEGRGRIASSTSTSKNGRMIWVARTKLPLLNRVGTPGIGPALIEGFSTGHAPRVRTVAVLTVFLALLPSLASARTIVFTDADCDMMAAINADAPRMSWAATHNAPAEFGNHFVDLSPKATFLIRYPIEKIAAGNRITKAELTIPTTAAYPVIGVRVNVRRCLVSWGPGVCHLYRTLRPKPLEWTKPGAAGVGKDRAAKPTASALVKGGGEHVFNVTEDVELWYSKTVENYGWLLTAEDPDTMMRLSSPYWGGPKGWKLKITYEPK